jgi:hypothetical protein
MTRSVTKLSETLRSRWFSIGLHAALWVLLLLAAMGSGLGGHAPQFYEALANPATVITPVPVAKLQLLFVPANATHFASAATNLNLFTTTYFVPRTPPPVTSPAAPPPPPPTTWKVELTYQGFYRTGDGPKYALVRVLDKLVSIPVGGMVVTNLFVVDAAMQTLTLTNTAVQTNVLALNAKQSVEVPLK